MKISVLHTGGTIAMHTGPQGGVSLDAANPLFQAAFQLDPAIKLSQEAIFNYPSPYITPLDMLRLKERIEELVSTGTAGVVITHGTDTLEETAYFLDTTIGDLVPIAITGAMRSSNDIGSDGLYNFLNAIKVAADPKSRGNGTLVVMNDEIHSARYVTKTHTTNVATFRTPTFGPIGLVTKDGAQYFQKLVSYPRKNIRSAAGKIPIVKAYAGMTSDIFRSLSQAKIDGLVIEALGAGNLPPATLPGLELLLNENVPICLVSRCFNGVAEPVYDYRGGGMTLAKMGVIFIPALNSQKARLKLLIALNSDLNEADRLAFLLQ